MRFAYPGYGLRATWLSGQSGGRGGEQVAGGFLRWDRAFQLQQEMLGRQAAAEAGEGAVGADHAVAGQDDRQRVAAVGGADRAHRCGAADAQRKLRIADGAAIGDIPQRQPYLALERRALRRQRQLEAAALAIEVFLQLVARLAQQRMVAGHPAEPALRMAVLRELDRVQARIAGGHGQQPDRAVEPAVVDGAHGVTSASMWEGATA